MTVHYIHVDSKNRDTSLYPHGNAYVVHLPKPINSVVRIELVSAKVPNSMYNLTNGSNIMATTYTSNVSIPPGFYSASLLEEALNGKLDPNHETVQYSEAEGKFLYFTKSPGAYANVYSSELNRMLGGGFPNATDSSVNISSSSWDYGVRSPRVVDFSLNEYVFLDIEEFRTPYFTDAVATPTTPSAGNMFAIIPVDVLSGQIKTFKEGTDFFFSQALTSQQTVSRLTVRWYDRNMRLLNFQGFENNGFVLRIHTDQVTKTTLPLPDEEERKLVDEYTRVIKQRLAEEEAAKQKKKDEKIRIGKWVLFAGAVLLVLYWYIYGRSVGPVGVNPR